MPFIERNLELMDELTSGMSSAWSCGAEVRNNAGILNLDFMERYVFVLLLD